MHLILRQFFLQGKNLLLYMLDTFRTFLPLIYFSIENRWWGDAFSEFITMRSNDIKYLAYCWDCSYCEVVR